jgi:hypothetical protein
MERASCGKVRPILVPLSRLFAPGTWYVFLVRDDTHPAILSRMIEGYRRMTPAEKLARCGDLSTAVRQLAAARIRAEHPEASERDIVIRVARLLYPVDLISRASSLEPPRER